MGLRGLTFPTVTVETSGGPLLVRGLSFDHVFGLFNRRTVLVTRLFEMVVQDYKASEMDGTKAAELLVKMIHFAPTVVAEIIALAAGADPADEENFIGDVGIAKGLNLGEQVDALEKIASQTFTSAMPPGKMFGLVMNAMGLLPSPKR